MVEVPCVAERHLAYLIVQKWSLSFKDIRVHYTPVSTTEFTQIVQGYPSYTSPVAVLMKPWVQWIVSGYSARLPPVVKIHSAEKTVSDLGESIYIISIVLDIFFGSSAGWSNAILYFGKNMRQQLVL